MNPVTQDSILLIHMGGLGDMCLSESTFLSLSRHFGTNLSALGYSRFLQFFREYFQVIHSVESAKWLYLFSDRPSRERWRRIVFIGKDRQGHLRARWQEISDEELVIIDAFPDESFPGKGLVLPSRPPLTARPVHVEEYQLSQLKRFGITPVRKQITPRPRNRVILYPEVSVSKSKWHHDNFIELYNNLRSRGVETYILKSLGLTLPLDNALVMEDLADIKAFFDGGGVFVSNDSGMAHFAGICGLFTITIFSDFDPTVWHPRGDNISLRTGIERIDVETLTALTLRVLTDEEF